MISLFRLLYISLFNVIRTLYSGEWKHVSDSRIDKQLKIKVSFIIAYTQFQSPNSPFLSNKEKTLAPEGHKMIK
jgi:hypothetical protein